MNKRFFYTTIIAIFILSNTIAQLNFNTQIVAHGKVYVTGYGISICNDFLSKKKISFTTQIGGMWLWHYNDFVDGKFKCNIYQLTQLVSYKLINKIKYKLSPTIGVNYNVIEWHAKLNPPYNQIPVRASVTGFGKGNLVVSSANNPYKGSYYENGLGIVFQLKNEFRLNEKFGLIVSPFYGDTFTGGQNHGGVNFGLLYIYK